MPPKKVDLTFVVTTNPYDASNEANKKRVRSVAALKSWPERRKRTFEQFEKAGGGSGTFLVEQPTPFTDQAAPTTTPHPSIVEADVRKQDLVLRPEGRSPQPAAPAVLKDAGQRVILLPRSRRPKSPSSQRNVEYGSNCQIFEPKARSLPPPPHSCRGEASNPTDPDAGQAVCELPREPCTRISTPEIPCLCWKCKPERHAGTKIFEWSRARRRLNDGRVIPSSDSAMLTPPTSPSPEQPIAQTTDPFNCYPVPYKPWFDGVLHHMLTVFAPRGWPALKITREQGLKWEWFMTQHALAEPALFYVRLLFATGDLIKLGVLGPQISYWLRAQAIKAINEALADPKRATSDPLILAVGRIALHESFYGDEHAAHTIHRPAQKHMIQIRGGMKNLEFPELVKRLMRWSDTVMSKAGGTERFLEDDEATPNFSMKESVSVLDRWVPTEAQELRRKIKISDLVNDDQKEGT